MKDEEPELSDRDRYAIDAIRRELDREFGEGYPESLPKPAGWSQRALLVAGILGLVTLVVATAAVVSKIVPADPNRALRGTATIQREEPRTGPVFVPTIEQSADATGTASVDPVPTFPKRENRAVASPGRVGSRRVHRGESPCPPGTHVAVSPRVEDRDRARAVNSVAWAGRRPGIPDASRRSAGLAVDHSAREPSLVQAP